MSKLSVLVTDDEPLAREMVAAMVTRDADLEVVGIAADGLQAAREIKRLQPDIVLLDIEMPEASGLDAVRALRGDHQPIYILVTAFQKYAAEAFDAEVLDYVLKPVSEKRLTAALDRAKRRIREHRLSEVAEKVVSLTSGFTAAVDGAGTDCSSTSYLSRLPITAAGRTRFIDVENIVWIESQDYYLRVHTKDGNPLIRATLKALSRRLDPTRFRQARRGALVNLAEVTEIRKLFKGAHSLLLSDGTELRISRSRWPAIQELLSPTLRRG